MKKAGKGEYGYFRWERFRRSLISGILLIAAGVIIVTGIIMHGNLRNIFTVFGMVMMIPFAMSLTGTIMVFLHKSLPEDRYNAIHEREGSLLMAYELYVTNEKGNSMLDAVAICGSEIVGLVSEKRSDKDFTKEYITKVMRQNGYKVNVHLMDSLPRFLERMDSLNEHADSLREGIAFRKDERYPDYTREELIWHLLTRISL